MFITNNHESFHLWWKKNLVKHHKVSKYYRQDCRSCISKINNTFIGNAEDLDTVMPISNLLEYSGGYPTTSGNSWKYYRDEVNDDENKNNEAGN